jgi:glycosyltransferase involved in cell wall biosynthesis
MIRLSACLITLNEERNLPRLLASLGDVADEILIVDAGSNDRTGEIAGQHGAKFIMRDWTGYADQRNFAAAQAAYDWILALDADEELSERLRESIKKWKSGEPLYHVYELNRLAWYLGAWIKHSGWYPDRKRRLYHREHARFEGKVHEALRFQGAPGRLKGELYHYTVNSFEEHIANVNHYTTLAAKQLHEDGKRVWRPGMWLAPGWSWLQTFVFQAGFLDGHRGWLIAWMAARSVYLKYKKLGVLIGGGTIDKLTGDNLPRGLAK